MEYTQKKSNFIIQKIYTKDLSFEAPNTPEIFQVQWKPEINVNVDTSPKKISDNTYEVELSLTVTVKNSSKNAYLIEVSQVGIFTIENIPDDQMEPMLGAFCPTTLFPYAKEAVDSLINRGGFPQINLAPINFDALYMQKLSQKQKSEKTQH